jgi:hypothetical protein
LTVIVVVPDPLIEEIVGAVVQVLEDKLKCPELAVAASANVTVSELGVVISPQPALGEVLATEGPKLSTVMVELCAEAED